MGMPTGLNQSGILGMRRQDVFEDEYYRSLASGALDDASYYAEYQRRLAALQRNACPPPEDKPDDWRTNKKLLLI